MPITLGKDNLYASITVLVVSDPIKWEIGYLVINVNTDIESKTETLKNENNELDIVIPGYKVYKKDRFTGRIYCSSLSRRIKILMYKKNFRRKDFSIELL